MSVKTHKGRFERATGRLLKHLQEKHGYTYGEAWMVAFPNSVQSQHALDCHIRTGQSGWCSCGTGDQ